MNKHHSALKRAFCILPTASFTMLAALSVSARGEIVQRWLTQWGGNFSDQAKGVAIDGTGQIWVAGETASALGGTPNAGQLDVFLTPLSSDGVVGASTRRGGTLVEQVSGIAIVGGNQVIAVGKTGSPESWDGVNANPSFSGSDALSVTYSTAGDWLGTTRFAPSVSYYWSDAASQGSNLLLAGYVMPDLLTSSGASLSLFDSTGTQLWNRKVGTSSATALGTAAALDSAGNAYMVGTVSGSLPGLVSAGSRDFFVARYDGSGNQTLLAQKGSTGLELPMGMLVDGNGSIYVTGITSGPLGGESALGGDDAFLMKLDGNGNELWTRLIGTPGGDSAWGLVMDLEGNVWIGGSMGADAFVARYDESGSLLDQYLWATPSADVVTGLANAADGSVIVVGYTKGSLGAANAGFDDAWAASVAAVPEPGVGGLLLGGFLGLGWRRRR